MEEIERFIEGMRNEGTVRVFTEGYCYWFAWMLAGRFGGDLMYNPVLGHFCMRDGSGAMWDVTGMVADDGRWQEWWLYVLNEPLDAERVRRYCIEKAIYDEEK